MQSGFVRMICQIGIFVICAQAIVHFRPKAAYEKYLKLLVSAMMVLQIFLFVGGILSTDGKQELAERTRWFADSLAESMEKAAENAFFSEDDLEFDYGDESSLKSDIVPEISIRIESVEPIRIGTTQ